MAFSWVNLHLIIYWFIAVWLAWRVMLGIWYCYKMTVSNSYDQRFLDSLERAKKSVMSQDDSFEGNQVEHAACVAPREIRTATSTATTDIMGHNNNRGADYVSTAPYNMMAEIHEQADNNNDNNNNGDEEEMRSTQPVHPPVNVERYSGEYDLSYHDQQGNLVCATLHLRFVRQNDGGDIYDIFGHGTRPYAEGRRHSKQSISRETTVVNGVCNAKRGLAWWTERMDYGRHRDSFLSSVDVQHFRDPNPDRIVSWMTMLSHGKFDFRAGSFQGWFYGQVRESMEYDNNIEQQGNYLSFVKKFFQSPTVYT